MALCETEKRREDFQSQETDQSVVIGKRTGRVKVFERKRVDMSTFLFLCYVTRSFDVCVCVCGPTCFRVTE